jgi:5-oxoprolinase (ATP-hydrolysing)
VLDPGFVLRVDDEGVLRLRDEQGARTGEVAADAADPVRLEGFGNRCMSIAEQMGAVLRNTSVSTNIKERLDYSCAVFDGKAGSSPTRRTSRALGAMAETVAVVRSRFPRPRSGRRRRHQRSVRGRIASARRHRWSRPCSRAEARPDFFVASRGHHADIGGTSPGSIPPTRARSKRRGC